MRVLIVDLYKVLYSKTRAKWFSIWGAVIYISILNFITIKGLGLLMEGWLTYMKFVRVLYRFPFFVLLLLALISINYALITPIQNLKKERQKKPHILPILVYTGVCIVLLIYTVYSNRIF